MPSFDIKSELNSHEVTNAVDQADRIINNRFDFKGKGAKFVLGDGMITLHSQEEFQLHQMLPILKESLTKRGIDLKCLKAEEIEVSTGKTSQQIILKEGIDKETSKKITQIIKSSHKKVKVVILGENIRISGKKRDILQDIIQSIKSAKIDIPLQFENFRD